MRPEIVFTEETHSYTVNGQPVPGVTSVLGTLDKAALPNWAASKTTQGVARLLVERRLPTVSNVLRTLKAEAGSASKYYERKPLLEAIDELTASPTDEAALASGLALIIKRRLKSNRLDHRASVSDSIVRGKSVHKALEDWINDRRVPSVGDYPPHHRGYIRGLTRFLMEWTPDFLESEKFVGSAVHGFAGTRDTTCVVRHGDHGLVLLDLKTSKRVWWETQFPQLGAYELAGVECGESPTDKQGIVRVAVDGSYEVRWCPDIEAAQQVFLCTLATYKARKALEAAVKRAD